MLTEPISTTIPTEYPYIVKTPGVMSGEPRLDGHRIRVRDILAMRDAYGHTPQQILELNYPHLTLAKIYAALAYAEDHREEMERLCREEDEFVARFQRENPHLIGADLSGDPVE